MFYVLTSLYATFRVLCTDLRNLSNFGNLSYLGEFDEIPQSHSFKSAKFKSNYNTMVKTYKRDWKWQPEFTMETSK